MKTKRGKTVVLWRFLIAAQAVVWAVFSALRVLGVFSFRMKYVPLLALVFVVADLVVFALLYDRRHAGDAAYPPRRRTFLLLLLFALLASVPLFTDYIVDGHDIQFHLFRIEGVKDGLMEGQFPVRLHPNTLYGYGYANPVFYPELLLYFPAALRLCGFSIMGAYKTFLFCLNVLTAYIAYVSFSRMFRSRTIGIAGSAFYTLALYRLINLYTRAAVGEASAMAFLPLLSYGMYQILTADTERSDYRRAFLPLTLGMTGLIGTHLLSCEMALPLLAVVCLCRIRVVFQKKRLWAICKAAVVTALLSLCFLVPMLDYLGHDTYQVFHYSVTNRAHEALNIAQLFPLLPGGMGESIALSEGIAGEMPLGLGFCAALVLLAWPVLRARAKNAAAVEAAACARMARLCYVLALALLIMTTSLFPWEGVYNLGGVFAQLANMLQFPWRLLAPATLLVTIVACACFRLLPAAVPEPFARRLAAYTLCLFALITPLAYCDRLLQQGDALHVRLFADLDQTSSVGDAEYLPHGSDGTAPYRIDEPVNAAAGLNVESFSRAGTRITIAVSNAASADGAVDLPLIYYPGYTAFAADGGTFALEKGAFCRIRLIVPAGFAGTIRVVFSGRPLWRAAEAVSFLTAAALAAVYVRARKRGAPLKASAGEAGVA